MAWLLTALLCSTVLVPARAARTAAATTTMVSNVHPRLDNTSSLFDAHDGNTVQFEAGGPFYYFAMGYGKCVENGRQANGFCGQISNNTVGVWRSSTLASRTWERLSSFQPSSSGWPKCTYFRSHALRSHATGQYVLYLNGQSGHDNSCSACPAGSAQKCLLAGTSSTPEGPFKYHGVVPVRYTAEGGAGDFALFQDDDDARTAYVIYKRSGAAPGAMGHRMTLQQLQPSLLAAVPADKGGSAGIIGAPFVEAPAMFKREGYYYALFGGCCPFCAHGTGIGVYTAPHPLGPWQQHGNVGCQQQDMPAGCGCGLPIPAKLSNLTCPNTPRHPVASVTFAQQNSVIVTGGGNVVWTGDRWQSACAATVAQQGLPPTGLPADQDCVKAWDLQYWSTLQWDSTVTPPLPKQLVWEDETPVIIQAA